MKQKPKRKPARRFVICEKNTSLVCGIDDYGFITAMTAAEAKSADKSDVLAIVYELVPVELE